MSTTRVGPRRIASGLLTDDNRPLEFEFDDRRLRGLAGDTVASALLAQGVRLVGRSFKYHRPRGIFTAGYAEPCALIDIVGRAGREPNRPATTVPLSDGLRVCSQNRWPSLEFDLLSINSLFAAVLPAGFYYKTFTGPGWAWEKIYEPLIRRAAGLGVLDLGAEGPLQHGAETVHDHTDVLVIGAGTAGLAAARRLAQSGLRVLLVERDATPGGGSLLDPRWQNWRAETLAALAATPTLRVLCGTHVIAAHDHGVYAAVETLSDTDGHTGGLPRERLRVIRARRLLLASGANERLIACANNDRPGVMLAGAALAYLRRYGVAVGERPVLFANSDWAYESAFALHEAGIRLQGIVDPRSDSAAAERARALGIPLFSTAVVSAVEGSREVKGVRIAGVDGTSRATLAADCLLISGGYQPESALATQAGGQLQWRDELAAFAASLPGSRGAVTGAAAGVFGLAAAARHGELVAAALATELVNEINKEITREPARHDPTPDTTAPWPEDPRVTPPLALWEVPGRGKAFVDLQHDVTVNDVRLAHREGYEHVEHMKRYTTHGMATDQGRSGGLVGAAVLAAARGQSPAEVGLPTPRPYVHPTTFAAFAGGEVGAHLRPVRHFPAHESQLACGAKMVVTGLWLRPQVYSEIPGWEPVLRETRAVRECAGVGDASSLGKIDLQGTDAARFLDFIYANRFSTLQVGKARYGIMLREDGFLFDDGTTARLGERHFLLTTTTANHAAVLEHLEFHAQVTCADWDLVLTDVTEQWAQFSIAGPRARELLQAVMPGADLSGSAVPFLAAMPASIAGVAGRLFRISFSGELAFEVAVPANHADRVWNALLEAARPLGALPYGVEALNTLRIEKGHVTTAELDGNATAHDLGFQRMLKAEGDYVGRVLAQRPALTSPQRRQLVALRPTRRDASLRSGAQLVTREATAHSIGHISSCTPAVLLEGWLALAMLENGRERIGSRLLAVSPVHNESVEVEVINPHWFDPENSRVRS